MKQVIMGHTFKLDTKIRFDLNIGIVGERNYKTTVGEALGITDQEELDTMSALGIRESLSAALREWSDEFIDRSWGFMED